VADPVGVGKMVEEVYTELHRIAGGYVRRERAQSVQATDLVHEAYLRLARDASPRWQNRTHFIAIAAIAMRRLLVERARARHAAKRGGDNVAVTLDDTLLADAGTTPLIDLIALDRALTELAAFDPDQAKIVEFRYFGGLSVEETAEALDVSPATVKRHWTVARAWLLRAMAGPES
jgi:RNA polymerase sigma factor (TIGR02999 family)